MRRSRAGSFGRSVLATLRADRRDGVTRAAGLVLLAYAVRFAIGLAAGALVARALGPGPFGAYAVAGAVIAIGATLGDFGFSQSATRQIAADLASAPDRAFRTAAVYARHRLLGAVLVFGASLIFTAPIAALVNLSGSEGRWLVRLAGATVLAAAANGVVSTIHHSLRNYRWLVLGQICTSLATLAGFAVLYAADRLSLTAAVAVGVVGNLFSLALGLALLPREWRHALSRPIAWREGESRSLRSFAGWLGVSGVLTIVLAQLDLLLVARFLDAEDVGLYGLALALAFKADAVNQALRTTLLPAVSSLSGAEAYAAYAGRSVRRSLVLAVPLLLVLPIVPLFIEAVYGSQYRDAAPIFYALMGIVLFDLLTSSVLLLTFPMNVPRWIASSDAVAVVTLAAVGVVLIPSLGVYGAVAAKLIAKLAAALVRGGVIVARFRAERKRAGLGVPAPDTASTP